MHRVLFFIQVLLSLISTSCLRAEEATPSPQEGFWGYHLILDCRGCAIDKITDPTYLKEFIVTLVDAIDMKRYGEPVLAHFADHDPEAAGYSLMQLIETSSITGHFVDKNGDAYIDIFSCKYFEPDVAMEVVEKLLQPTNIRAQFLPRKA